MNKFYIIADIGSNFTNIDSAKEQIKQAALAGASAAKFQLYTHKELYGFDDEYSSIKSNHLPKEWIPELAQCAKDNEVDFLCSVFSEEGVDIVDPYVKMHKLASWEISHLPLIEKMKTKGKPIIVSTGSSQLIEIRKVVGLIKPLEVILLQTVSVYPAKPESYNLSVLTLYRQILGDASAKVGLSDHTKGIEICGKAVMYGASVFEVHYTHKPMDTPDANVSLSSEGLKAYKTELEWSARQRGNSQKMRTPEENEGSLYHRRRLKIIQDIEPGQKLYYGVNYGIYRSKTDDRVADHGFHWFQYDGKTTNREKKIGEGLSSEDVDWEK